MIVNANEECAKDEILADLYALRAGMSLIFDEIQKVEEIDDLPNLIKRERDTEQWKKEALKDKEEEIADIVEDINEYEKEIDKVKNEIEQLNRVKEQKNSELEGFQNESYHKDLVEIKYWNEKVKIDDFESYAEKKAKKNNKTLHFWSQATGIIGSLVILVFLGMYWWLTSSGEDVAEGPFVSILLTIGLPLIILSFILKRIYKSILASALQWHKRSLKEAYSDALHKAKENYWEQVTEKKDEIINLSYEIKKSEDKIVQLTQSIEECQADKKEHEEKCQSIRKECLAIAKELPIKERLLEQYQTENTVAVHLKLIECIETALHKTYDSFLDERDWENIDLIIYYFETGRVDTLKEALWHVDRQRQADEITEAIYTASEAICHSIERNIKRLGEGLSKSFSVISAQISEIAKQQKHSIKANEKIIQNIEGLKKSSIQAAEDARRRNEQAIKNLESKLTQQIEGIDLSNALLKNIENDSREMILEWENMKYKYSL